MTLLKKLPVNAWIIGVFSAVLIISFIAGPTLSAGWSWDFGNGLGFSALAGLICLGLIAPKLCGIKSHQWMGYITVLIILLHALWFLLGDAVAVQYILPGAPAYMWSGVLAFVLVVFLLVIALPSYRYRAHQQHEAFRRWHLWLSILTLVATLYHMVGSGFYIRSWLHYGSLLIVVLIAYRCAHCVRENAASSPRPTDVFAITGLLGALLFTVVRNIGL